MIVEPLAEPSTLPSLQDVVANERIKIKATLKDNLPGIWWLSFPID